MQKKVVRQKENDGVPSMDSISETFAETLHLFPLSCFRKDVYHTILYEDHSGNSCRDNLSPFIYEKIKG